MKYECLIIDTVNLAYKTFLKKEENKIELISKKPVYKDSICNFIRAVENLRKKYLYDDGKIYLLIDNYFSRADLQSTFLYATRKELDESYKKTRKKENKEFYNSLNLIRYYYLIGPNNYATCRIEGLEADDLVKPLLLSECKDKNCLMITSDLDWCRYLSNKVHWLPSLSSEPEDFQTFTLKIGLNSTEESIEKDIICYKAIFGDESDNISPLIRINDERHKDFLEAIKDIRYPEDLILKSRKAISSNNTIFQTIKNNENQFLINLQLVSTINCNIDNFLKELTYGHAETTLFKMVREILGLELRKTVFKFGGVKRPRI